MASARISKPNFQVIAFKKGKGMYFYYQAGHELSDYKNSKFPKGFIDKDPLMERPEWTQEYPNLHRLEIVFFDRQSKMGEKKCWLMMYNPLFTVGIVLPEIPLELLTAVLKKKK